MKKFEEEMKEWFGSPTGFNMEFQSGYEAYSALVKRFKGYISPEDYQNTVASNEAYAKSNLVLSKENAKFVVENIELEKQITELKSQLEKQQPEIPEVPQFVADWYEENKNDLEYHIWKYIRCWNDHEKDDFYDFMNGAHSNPIETLINMKSGYTVTKEKRFYLKNKLTGLYLYESSGKFSECEEGSISWALHKTEFTQQEIDSMETGSYEQIPVEEKNG